MAMDTRDHILQTALTLFLQKSFRDVTLKEIVESSGLSKGAFYHYFDSKEKVFDQVVRAFFNSFQIGNYQTLPTTSLRAFYHDWAKRIGKPDRLVAGTGQGEVNFEVNHYYLIFDALKRLPDFKAEFARQYEEELRAWVRIIQAAQTGGEVQEAINPTRLAKLFITTADGVIFHLMTQHSLATVQDEVLAVWNAMYELVKA